MYMTGCLTFYSLPKNVGVPYLKEVLEKIISLRSENPRQGQTRMFQEGLIDHDASVWGVNL